MLELFYLLIIGVKYLHKQIYYFRIKFKNKKYRLELTVVERSDNQLIIECSSPTKFKNLNHLLLF